MTMLVSVLVAIVAWFGLMLLAVFVLAKLDVFFTFVNEGEIKFLDRGETLHQTLVNVRGMKLEGEKLISGPTPASRNPLTRWLGIRGPFLWPIYKVHEYDFAWDKLVQDVSDPKMAASEAPWKIERRKRPVRSLFFQFIYPVAATNLEMKDQLKISVFGTVTAQVVVPYIAVYLLKGNWFPAFIAAIEGAIADYVKDFNYAEFIAVKKEGNDSTLSLAVRLPDIVNSLQDSVGVVPSAYNFLSFSIADDPNAEIKKATEATKLAEENGRALVAKATKEAEAKGIQALADANYIARTEGAQATAWRKQAKATGGTRVLVAREQRRGAEGLGATTKARTFVAGPATPLVNVGNEPEEPTRGGDPV